MESKLVILFYINCVLFLLHVKSQDLEYPEEAVTQNEFVVEHVDINDDRYMLIANDVTWYEAYTICEFYEFSLALPDNDETLTKLNTFLYEAETYSTFYWLGARSEDGKIIVESRYSDLEIFEPFMKSHSRGRKMIGPLSCLAIETHSHMNLLVGIPCEKKLPFLCHKPTYETFTKPMQSLPLGKLIYKASSFNLYYGRITWPEAYGFCMDLGMRLAIVSDLELARLLSSKMLKTRPSLERAWIGATYTENKTWNWISTGVQLPYKSVNGYPPWYPKDVEKYDEGCLILDRHYNHSASFIPVRCERNMDFICEREHAVKKNNVDNKPPIELVYEEIGITIFSIMKNWTQAMEFCIEQGGILAEPENYEMLKLIAVTLGDQWDEPLHVWLGGRFKNGKWIWATSNISIPHDKDSEGFLPWCDEYFDERYPCLNLDRIDHDTPITYGIDCSELQYFVCTGTPVTECTPTSEEFTITTVEEYTSDMITGKTESTTEEECSSEIPTVTPKQCCPCKPSTEKCYFDPPLESTVISDQDSSFEMPTESTYTVATEETPIRESMESTKKDWTSEILTESTIISEDDCSSETPTDSTDYTEGVMTIHSTESTEDDCTSELLTESTIITEDDCSSATPTDSKDKTEEEMTIHSTESIENDCTSELLTESTIITEDDCSSATPTDSTDNTEGVMTIHSTESTEDDCTSELLTESTIITEDDCSSATPTDSTDNTEGVMTIHSTESIENDCTSELLTKSIIITEDDCSSATPTDSTDNTKEEMTIHSTESTEDDCTSELLTESTIIIEDDCSSATPTDSTDNTEGVMTIHNTESTEDDCTSELLTESTIITEDDCSSGTPTDSTDNTSGDCNFDRTTHSMETTEEDCTSELLTKSTIISEDNFSSETPTDSTDNTSGDCNFDRTTHSMETSEEDYTSELLTESTIITEDDCSSETPTDSTDNTSGDCNFDRTTHSMETTEEDCTSELLTESTIITEDDCSSETPTDSTDNTSGDCNFDRTHSTETSEEDYTSELLTESTIIFEDNFSSETPTDSTDNTSGDCNFDRTHSTETSEEDYTSELHTESTIISEDNSSSETPTDSTDNTSGDCNFDRTHSTETTEEDYTSKLFAKRSIISEDDHSPKTPTGNTSNTEQDSIFEMTTDRKENTEGDCSSESIPTSEHDWSSVIPIDKVSSSATEDRVSKAITDNEKECNSKVSSETYEDESSFGKPIYRTSITEEECYKILPIKSTVTIEECCPCEEFTSEHGPTEKTIGFEGHCPSSKKPTESTLTTEVECTSADVNTVEVPPMKIPKCQNCPRSPISILLNNIRYSLIFVKETRFEADRSCQNYVGIIAILQDVELRHKVVSMLGDEYTSKTECDCDELTEHSIWFTTDSTSENCDLLNLLDSNVKYDEPCHKKHMILCQSTCLSEIIIDHGNIHCFWEKQIRKCFVICHNEFVLTGPFYFECNQNGWIADIYLESHHFKLPICESIHDVPDQVIDTVIEIDPEGLYFILDVSDSILLDSWIIQMQFVAGLVSVFPATNYFPIGILQFSENVTDVTHFFDNPSSCEILRTIQRFIPTKSRKTYYKNAFEQAYLDISNQKQKHGIRSPLIIFITDGANNGPDYKNALLQLQTVSEVLVIGINNDEFLIDIQRIANLGPDGRLLFFNLYNFDTLKNITLALVEDKNPYINCPISLALLGKLPIPDNYDKFPSVEVYTGRSPKGIWYAINNFYTKKDAENECANRYMGTLMSGNDTKLLFGALRTYGLGRIWILDVGDNEEECMTFDTSRRIIVPHECNGISSYVCEVEECSIPPVVNGISVTSKMHANFKNNLSCEFSCEDNTQILYGPNFISCEIGGDDKGWISSSKRISKTPMCMDVEEFAKIWKKTTGTRVKHGGTATMIVLDEAKKHEDFKTQLKFVENMLYAFKPRHYSPFGLMTFTENITHKIILGTKPCEFLGKLKKIRISPHVGNRNYSRIFRALYNDINDGSYKNYSKIIFVTERRAHRNLNEIRILFEGIYADLMVFKIGHPDKRDLLDSLPSRDALYTIQIVNFYTYAIFQRFLSEINDQPQITCLPFKTWKDEEFDDGSSFAPTKLFSNENNSYIAFSCKLPRKEAEDFCLKTGGVLYNNPQKSPEFMDILYQNKHRQFWIRGEPCEIGIFKNSTHISTKTYPCYLANRFTCEYNATDSVKIECEKAKIMDKNLKFICKDANNCIVRCQNSNFHQIGIDSYECTPIGWLGSDLYKKIEHKPKCVDPRSHSELVWSYLIDVIKDTTGIFFLLEVNTAIGDKDSIIQMNFASFLIQALANHLEEISERPLGLIASGKSLIEYKLMNQCDFIEELYSIPKVTQSNVSIIEDDLEQCLYDINNSPHNETDTVIVIVSRNRKVGNARHFQSLLDEFSKTRRNKIITINIGSQNIDHSIIALSKINQEYPFVQKYKTFKDFFTMFSLISDIQQLTTTIKCLGLTKNIYSTSISIKNHFMIPP